MRACSTASLPAKLSPTKSVRCGLARDEPWQFVHEVGFVLHSAGCVDQHHVDVLGLGRSRPAQWPRCRRCVGWKCIEHQGSRNAVPMLNGPRRKVSPAAAMTEWPCDCGQANFAVAVVLPVLFTDEHDDHRCIPGLRVSHRRVKSQ